MSTHPLELNPIHPPPSPACEAHLCWPRSGCGVGWAGPAHHRLMNWLRRCCQWVCALGEGAPVTAGNPSYGTRRGAAIMSVQQEAIGAGDPWRSPDPHTAVTPLETHTERWGGERLDVPLNKHTALHFIYRLLQDRELQVLTRRRRWSAFSVRTKPKTPKNKLSECTN